MAALAIAVDAAVIKDGGGPKGRGVTIVAILRCLNVRRRLAAGDVVIVAARAGADDRAMIHAGQLRPSAAAVASIATFLGIDVIDGLRRGVDGPAAFMASGAAPRRSFKDAVDMAGLARNAGMTILQQKSGDGVIELFWRGDCAIRSSAKPRQRQHDGNAAEK